MMPQADGDGPKRGRHSADCVLDPMCVGIHVPSLQHFLDGVAFGRGWAGDTVPGEIDLDCDRN